MRPAQPLPQRSMRLAAISAMNPNLASPDRFAKNVRVAAVVVAELEFRDIEREILAADFVERADHATLNQRPETLNGVGMDSANYVVALGVIDNGMGKILIETVVAYPLVRYQQADFVGYRFANEPVQGGGADIAESARKLQNCHSSLCCS